MGENDDGSHVIVTTGFSSVADGIDNSKYSGTQFVNGKYQMAPEVIAGAKAAASMLLAKASERGLDLSRTAEWKDAARLDTSAKEITEDGLAALMLARSMGASTHVDVVGGTKTVSSIFDNALEGSLPSEKHQSILDGNDYAADKTLVFEMAKAIAVQNELHNTLPAGEGTADTFVQHVSTAIENGTLNILTVEAKRAR